jgi:hypothetical protein
VNINTALSTPRGSPALNNLDPLSQPPIHIQFMPTDFVLSSLSTQATGVSYVVTPQNARALCWMIAHTPPSQRPQHTIAQLDLDALLTFFQEAELANLSFEDNSNCEWNRITLIPGQPVLARFSGPHTAEIKATFETDTIPTCFDSRNPRCDVLSAIQRQNPTAIVSWERVNDSRMSG